MKLNVRIAFDPEEQEYIVSIDGITEIYGTGTTEAKAMLDFFQQYELITENPKRIKAIIMKLENETQI